MHLRTLLIPALLGMSAVAQAEVVTKSFDAAQIHALDVSNASGKITITGTPAAKTIVTARKIEFGKDCLLTIETSGSTLVVVAKNDATLSRSDCSVDLDIQVPREIALNLTNGAGPIQVDGTRGPVTFKVGSGAVRITGDVTALDGKSGNGAVQVVGLAGSGNLRAGHGEITLTYAKKPKRGSLDIKTGNGDTTVFLPADTKLSTSFLAGSGNLSNELGDAPNAPFTVVAKAGKGNLTIKKAL